MNVAPPSPLAVGLAALAMFLVGGIWYSPLLFGPAWARHVGLSEADQKTTMGRVFAVAAVVSLVFAVNLGFFIGGKSTAGFGAFAGFATGFGFMAMGLALSYVFARRPLALFLIDGGYHVAAATLAGTIIGALPA